MIKEKKEKEKDKRSRVLGLFRYFKEFMDSEEAFGAIFAWVFMTTMMALIINVLVFGRSFSNFFYSLILALAVQLAYITFKALFKIRTFPLNRIIRYALNQKEQSSSKKTKERALVELFSDWHLGILILISIVGLLIAVLSWMQYFGWIELAISDFKIPIPSIFLSSVLLVCIGLFLIRKILIEYRIAKGFFGTNRHEVTELIKFIKTNSEDIDLDGGDQGRRVFPEEVLNEDQLGAINGLGEPI